MVCLAQPPEARTGKSENTLKNYALHLAHIALHFNQLPTDLDIDQINDYLYLIQQRHACPGSSGDTPSDSYFKFTVYGRHFAFRLAGLNDKRIELPSIGHEKKLPVVLFRQEMKCLLKAPKLLKHRAAFISVHELLKMPFRLLRSLQRIHFLQMVCSPLPLQGQSA